MVNTYLKTNPAFLDPVIDDIHRVETVMRSQADGFHPDLRAATELLVTAGGKRIRPAMTLLIGQMLNAPLDSLITTAAAIELLHTATLVHDDLIDGAILRRGMPTLNSQWSAGATVLTGDFLFARAAKLAADTDSLPVIKLFAETLSIIVNGEITQLLASRCNISREDYYRRIYSKTASLFETAATSAALIGSSNEQVIEAIRRYGYEIGMAFQIIDDILDFTGEQTMMGKPVGSDLRQGLLTLPALYYIEDHGDDPIVKILLEGDCQNNLEAQNNLVEAIRKSPAIQQSHREAQQFVERGLHELHKQTPGALRQALEELANYIVQREI